MFLKVNKREVFFFTFTGYIQLKILTTLPRLSLSVFVVSLCFAPLQYFHNCLVNMGFSKLSAYSQCNAQQRNSKSLNSQPWAKDSVPLTQSTQPAERPTLPAYSTTYGSKVLPMVQMVVWIHLSPTVTEWHLRHESPQTQLCHNQATGALKRNCCNISFLLPPVNLISISSLPISKTISKDIYKKVKW